MRDHFLKILNLKTLTISMFALINTEGALADSSQVTFTTNEKACACMIGTTETKFRSSVTLSNFEVTRRYPDEDNLEIFFDEKDAITQEISGISFHPTYEQAYQNCRLTIQSYISSGLCAPGSAIPESSSLALNEVGERTRFFNLSAHEQATLTFALEMARIDSGNDFYSEIARIYQEQSYADRELLVELLRKLSGHKSKIKIINKRH
jgi:hypothetical protein